MWGWHGHRGSNGQWRGRGRFNWWIPLIFIGLFSSFSGGLRSPLVPLVLLFVIPAILFFVIPMIKRGRAEWGGDEQAQEKMKRDEYSTRDNAGEKPKRTPTYVMGDDGEVHPVPPPDAPRKRDDDNIEYV